MTKPTIACVPGAWHSPAIYDKAMQMLEKEGYSYAPITLASVGASPALQNFDEDVKAIRDCLTKLVEEEKDVVLVTHSYSGFPGTEAPVGLGKKDRAEKGLKGGVIRVVYVMGFAMPEGFQPLSSGAQQPEWVDDDSENGYQTVSLENAKRIFYNEADPEEAEKWAATLKPMSIGVWTSTQTYAAWRHIPSTFVICNKDNTVFTPEMIKSILEANRKIEPTAFDVVEELDADHCPMISRPELFADVLRRAAGGTS